MGEVCEPYLQGANAKSSTSNISLHSFVSISTPFSSSCDFAPPHLPPWEKKNNLL